MAKQGWWRRRGLGGLLALSLLSGSGCLSFLHPVDSSRAELIDPCRAVPKGCRDHVYIFLIHGMDPLDFANLAGLNRYLHHLGFNNTYYGQLYHTWHFEHELDRIHHDDPEAHFVLIGFSFGANMVRDIAQHAGEQGIQIDLLVYLGGNTLKNIPRDRPDNVCQIINILASGCIWNGAWMDGAVNVHETDVWHFGSPTHPQTVELLSQHLSQVACSVPLVETVEPAAPPAAQEEPTPRPVPAATTARRDAWDFLKPVSRLGEPRQPEP